MTELELNYLAKQVAKELSTFDVELIEPTMERTSNERIIMFVIFIIFLIQSATFFMIYSFLYK